ncbi:MAG TPA: radical SAM protein [Polyangia bacterium]|jgi:radical SAM protein with 4Fe4S-binding SPASM domain|nr:radical SAM protein [Polyangia bacterium]
MSADQRNIPPNGGCRDDEFVGVADGHQLIGQVQSWAYANVVPLNASIETTLRCNIRCQHCYNFDRDTKKDPCAADSEPELSADEILKLMTDLRAAGCLFLSLTGGEVLMHPQLFSFLDHAGALNLTVQLLSNGTLLRPGMAKRLSGYPNLLGVSVSIYGATPAVHDGITQVAGSWRRTWEGAERLRALGVAVRMKLIVMRGNAHEAAAMRAAATERGFAYLMDLTITARHDGDASSLGTRVTLEQLEDLYRGPLRDLAVKGARPVTEESFPCNCARGNVAISARGDVFPCVSVPMAAGNIRRQPFADIWAHSPVFQRIRGLRITDYEQCAPCPHQAHCGRDRGAAFNASGSYTGVDPFVCATAELAHALADETQAAMVDAANEEQAPAPVRLRVAR